MRKNLLLALLCLLTLGVRGQVTSTPTPLLEDSEDVVIYYHADEGNKGLMGEPSTAGIYAHTGVITNQSANGSDWKYAPSKWGDNSEKYKLEYVSPNLWKLNIGNIRKYYGITDAKEQVKQLAFVFRNAECTKEGKTAQGGDIFLTVYEDGLHISLTSDFAGTVIGSPTTLNLTASTTKTAAISISVNGKEIATTPAGKSLTAQYKVENFGTYHFTATAAANGEAATAEQTYTYLSGATAENYPGGVPKMGPVKNPDGSVTFCLGAPQKSQVIIVGSWDDFAIKNENQMKYQDYNGNRYFWTTVKGLDNTKPYLYYFLVDGTISVGDPYARLVLDPFNDKYIPKDVYPNLPEYPSDKVANVFLAVYQGNINDYKWTDRQFKRADKDNLVIYELLFRDFTGTEGKADGNGTVNKALEKIDYLKHLGVNAIELLPINEFNGNISWGYNPNFYFAPDKAYGTPDDYKRFIDTCHANGIAVILDVVFNQTDWAHPWYQMYAPGSNPFYNESAPHAYSVLNDMNQGNAMLQEQFKDVLKYWLEEYHVDGFRFDLVKGLGDNDSYANNGDYATNTYNASRVKRMKELHDAMREVDPTAYFINENLAEAKEENEMAQDGELNWANANNEGCQYAMGYQSGSALRKFYAQYDARLWGSTVSYLESHDEQRLAYKQNQWGAEGIKGNTENSMARLGSAAAQMIMCPGSHMIWMFSEMGNDQNTKNDTGGNNTDPKIVNWNLLDNEYHAGLVENYREMIEIRLANLDLFGKDALFREQCDESNWDNGRWLYSSLGDKEILTVVNPTTKAITMESLPLAKADNSAYYIYSKTYNSNGESIDAKNKRAMVPANSYVIIATNGVTGVERVTENETAYSTASEYTVYNLAGEIVNQGTGLTQLPTEPGLYIVKRGEKSLKTIVR